MEQDESDLNSQCRFNDTYIDTSELEGETESFRDKIKDWVVLHSIAQYNQLGSCLSSEHFKSVTPRSA